MSMPSALLGGGPDPRLVTEEGHGIASSMAYTRPQMRKLHDRNVQFEEYYYYAQKTRAEEDLHPKDHNNEKGLLSMIIPSKSDKGVRQIKTSNLDEKSPVEAQSPAEAQSPPEEKTVGVSDVDHSRLNFAKASDRAIISDEEWTNASRALRTASWGAIFYLITTDILGPFALPYAFASMGYGPGVALYTVFAGLAIYSGYLLWKMFLDLDSYEFPIKAYGDLGFRVFGSPVRYLFNMLQAVQLLLNVGLLVISNGEALSQAAKFKFCFAGCCAVWAGAGFVIGQVRTLQKFGWLANAAVWLNVLTMIVTMGAAAHTPPNYLTTAISAGAGLNNATSVTPYKLANGTMAFPAVQTTGGLPDSKSLVGSLDGAMNAVFAYGGAMIFPEFMSEMKRPRDFYKGMFGAQIFIYVVYMFYGLFIYSYQAQYTVNPTYLGISKYSLQTTGNVFAMVAALIAAGLYGNIGVKVLYNNVFVEWFNAPALTTRAGKYMWAALVPIYWCIAFVVGAGIPNFSALTAIVAALCILHFTYTFPPIMAMYYSVTKNAMLPGEGFDPASGQVIRHDKGVRRFIRGFMAGNIYLNIFNIIYFFGALALAGLGAYAAVESFIAGFRNGAINSFVCHSPVDTQA